MADTIDSPFTGNAASALESTSSRFFDVGRAFPESAGIGSFYKIPSSSTPAVVGPGSYSVDHTKKYRNGAASVFVSKTGRDFPSEARMSDPTVYCPQIVDRKSWTTPGGKFFTAPRIVLKRHERLQDDTAVDFSPLEDHHSEVPRTSRQRRRGSAKNDKMASSKAPPAGADSPDAPTPNLPKVVTPRGRTYLSDLWRRRQ